MTPQDLAQELHTAYRREQPLLIVKDIAKQSPLLSPGENTYAEAFALALQERGFVLLEGMALAWVPVDYTSSADYISRLSAARRADMRRKLKARARLEIEAVPTGDPRFDDAATVRKIYALYLNVYAQSEVHFDLLQEAFFAAVLRDGGSGGVLFTFRHAGELIGWKLCFVHGGMLLDKYVGFAYPQAREHNLYFVSWCHCLDEALTHYVASTTDIRVKHYLGATLTRTRNAVYVRNGLLRALLRCLAHYFENEPD
jgi:predicted N-acyltransferase